MAGWLEKMPGIRDVLNAAATVLPRRNRMQFTGAGVTVTDNGVDTTVVTMSGSSAATSLVFGASNQPITGTPASSGNVLQYNGSQWVGVRPGYLVADAIAAATTTTALTYAANSRRTWNGGTTPSFTASKTGAVDGATIVQSFPAGSLTSITFDANLDPTGTLAYALDDTAAAYILISTYYTGIDTIVTDFRKTVDM